jgi:hypothetical protein
MAMMIPKAVPYYANKVGKNHITGQMSVVGCLFCFWGHTFMKTLINCLRRKQLIGIGEINC